MRILLIEDDRQVAITLERMLAPEGFTCDVAELGEEGIERGTQFEYELILLDLKLPDIDGLDVLRRLRGAQIATPVLILSGQCNPGLKVEALRTGADDYLTKPFNPGELVARIRAVVRRTREHAELAIRTGKMSIHLASRVVKVDGSPVHLTEKEFAVLELLSCRKGKTVRKESFIEHFYGGVDEPNAKIIDVFVCKLRKKLAMASGGDDYIRTDWGHGYLLRDLPPEKSVDLTTTGRPPLPVAA